MIYWVFFLQQEVTKRACVCMCACRTVLSEYLPCCLDVSKERCSDAAQKSKELNDRSKTKKYSAVGSQFSSGQIKMCFMHISHPSNCTSLSPSYLPGVTREMHVIHCTGPTSFHCQVLLWGQMVGIIPGDCNTPEKLKDRSAGLWPMIWGVLDEMPETYFFCKLSSNERSGSHGHAHTHKEWLVIAEHALVSTGLWITALL